MVLMRGSILGRALLATLASVALVQGQTTYDWQWKQARATYYGTDDWNIHKGSCNFGYLWPKTINSVHGWDVAALNDGNANYEDSCGACFEVKCDPRWIGDNYGASFDRSQACFDKDASVVVRVTDVCPCTYPANFYSNKRWCCNDLPHLDLSIWAFEKLAETKWGVISLQYRPVPCDHTPDKVAPALASPTPGQAPPDGAKEPTRDWPDMSQNRAGPLFLFRNGYQNGFYDASWKTDVQPLQASAWNGMNGGAGLCGNIQPGGALALKGWHGAFQGRVGLQFWLYVGYPGYDGSSAFKPDIKINVAGSKGGCAPVRIYDVQPMYFQPFKKPYSSDMFWGWNIYFPAFAGGDAKAVINDPNSFGGCGSGNSLFDLDTVQFRNEHAKNWAWVCLDRIELI